MFFILSKVLHFLLKPIIWMVLLYVASLISKRAKVKRYLRKSIFILLIVSSNTMIVNELLLQWEIPGTPISNINKEYDLAILLTGVTNPDKKLNDRVHFNKGADRVNHTFQLYQLGIINKILVTGKSGRLKNPTSESEKIKKTLISWGVKKEDVYIENQSRNTHENAKYSAQFITKQNLKGNFLLITSAFHLRRASGCFKKEGVQFDTYATDFYGSKRKTSLDYLLIPSEKAFKNAHLLIHEIAGYVVYKLQGYL